MNPSYLKTFSLPFQFQQAFRSICKLCNSLLSQSNNRSTWRRSQKLMECSGHVTFYFFGNSFVFTFKFRRKITKRMAPWVCDHHRNPEIHHHSIPWQQIASKGSVFRKIFSEPRICVLLHWVKLHMSHLSMGFKNVFPVSSVAGCGRPNVRGLSPELLVD